MGVDSAGICLGAQLLSRRRGCDRAVLAIAGVLLVGMSDTRSAESAYTLRLFGPGFPLGLGGASASTGAPRFEPGLGPGMPRRLGCSSAFGMGVVFSERFIDGVEPGSFLMADASLACAGDEMSEAYLARWTRASLRVTILEGGRGGMAVVLRRVV